MGMDKLHRVVTASRTPTRARPRAISPGRGGDAGRGVGGGGVGGGVGGGRVRGVEEG